LPWLAERTEPREATFLPTEFHTDRPEGRRRQPDLVARVPARDGPPELILVHVEIEARARRGVGRRMWQYARLLRLRHPRLLVIPLLVTLQGGARGPGLRRETVREELWGEELASFHYQALHLGRCDAASLLARPEPLAWGLAALADRADMPPEVHKLRCLRAVVLAEGLDDLESFLLGNCVETYLQLEQPAALRFRELLENDEELMMALPEMTWAEQIEMRGRVEGIRLALLRLLELRFGPLSPVLRRRIRAFETQAAMEKLFELAFEVDSLDELKLDAR
ncbi:MAG TPA: hypothetical protein VKU40_10375, partial [Thermoanaerobaculia bacterium]|nr:hypothetical protein [Thermoanaerobaculia bacterium]